MIKIYIEKICDLGFSEVANSKSGTTQSAAAQIAVAQSEAAKKLLRNALSADFGIVGELAFTQGRHGKPYLVAPWFNVSHSDEYVACVVSDECEVGIDIQQVVPARMRVAERVFTPQQVAELDALDGAARDERFCELWVLREAEIKARGGSVLEALHSDGRTATTGTARLVDAPYGYRAAVAERA